MVTLGLFHPIRWQAQLLEIQFNVYRTQITRIKQITTDIIIRVNLLKPRYPCSIETRNHPLLIS
jgi:hypothetical protein